MPNELRDFDGEVRRCLGEICNIVINNSTRMQVSLPVLDGGMGVRSTEWLSSSAFIASAYSVARAVPDVFKANLEDYTAAATEVWTSLSNLEVPEGDLASVQRAWDGAVVKCQKEKVWSLATDVEQRARLFASFTPESGAWINGLPIVSLGSLLISLQFQLAVAVRLGVSVRVSHLSWMRQKNGRKGLSFAEL